MRVYARVVKVFTAKYSDAFDSIVEVARKRGGASCFFVLRFMPYGYSLQTQHLKHRVAVFGSLEHANSWLHFQEDKVDPVMEEVDTACSALYRFVFCQTNYLLKTHSDGWAQLLASSFLGERICAQLH